MYGLSAIFTIVEISTDATLSDLTIEGATDGERFTLSPQFDQDTFTYAAYVANRFDTVTLTATTNNGNATVAITGDSNASTPNTADLDLEVGDNTLTVTVTAQDTITALTYTITVTRAVEPPAPATVPDSWSLLPATLDVGDQFRLIFLSSTLRDGTDTDIATYNTFIQDLAATGHTDIQTHSSGFRVVGCTEDVDARGNTATTYTSTNKGVPIYWLNGAKVADEYEDFYDGSWDEERSNRNRNQLGANGRDTDLVINSPLTGCDNDGTERFLEPDSLALGSGGYVATGNPDSSIRGPIGGPSSTSDTQTRPMYGLSPVFTVVEGPRRKTQRPRPGERGQPPDHYVESNIPRQNLHLHHIGPQRDRRRKVDRDQERQQRHGGYHQRQ